MKTIAAIAVLSMVTFGLASQANAFKFSPPSTSFTASGPTSLTANGTTLACTWTFTGKTDAAGLFKVGGFSATGMAGCTSVEASNLPWLATATTAKNAMFTNVEVLVPAVFTCGPGSVKARDNASGQITFHAKMPGPCTFSGTVQTVPPVTIVP